MDMKQIAQAFGMSISELADYVGYSRPVLYCRQGVRNKARLQAAVRLLEVRNAVLMVEEKATAEERFRVRANAIKDFEQIMLKEGNDG